MISVIVSIAIVTVSVETLDDVDKYLIDDLVDFGIIVASQSVVGCVVAGSTLVPVEVGVKDKAVGSFVVSITVGVFIDVDVDNVWVTEELIGW